MLSLNYMTSIILLKLLNDSIVNLNSFKYDSENFTTKIVKSVAKSLSDNQR